MAGPKWDLIGSGPVSYLFNTGKSYKDFHLRVEARINPGGNSGVFFRTQFGPGVPNGYEAQINSTHRDPNKTGSLYMRGGPTIGVAQSPVPPNEWFAMEVIARDNHIVILVNGHTLTDYVDPQRRFTSGHIALQQHNPETVVRFRKIEIKELTSTNAVPTEAKRTIPPVSSALDPFRSEIDRAQQVYSRAVGQADSRMKAAFTQVLGSLKSAKMDVEQRLKLIDAVKTEKAAFESLGRVPLSAPMRIALEEYLMSIKSAREARAVPFDKAITLYTKHNDDDRTRECLAARQQALNPRFSLPLISVRVRHAIMYLRMG